METKSATMNPDQLNEVASLLHIASEIMTNHPNMASIARACQTRLNEIDAEFKAAEAKAVEAEKKAAAEKQAKEFVAPKPGDSGYVAPEKPAGQSMADKYSSSTPEVERRV